MARIIRVEPTAPDGGVVNNPLLIDVDRREGVYTADIGHYLRAGDTGETLAREMKEFETDFARRQDFIDLLISKPVNIIEMINISANRWCGNERNNFLTQIANFLSGELIEGSSTSTKGLVYCSSHRTLFLASKALRLFRGFILDSVPDKEVRIWLLKTVKSTSDGVYQAQKELVGHIARDMRLIGRIYIERGENGYPSTNLPVTTLTLPTTATRDADETHVLESFMALYNSEEEDDPTDETGDDEEPTPASSNPQEEPRTKTPSRFESTCSVLDDIFKHLHAFYESVIRAYERELYALSYFLEETWKVKKIEAIREVLNRRMPELYSSQYTSSHVLSRMFCAEVFAKGREKATNAECEFASRCSTMICELVSETDAQIRKEHETLNIKNIAKFIERNEKCRDAFDHFLVRLCQYYYTKFCVDKTHL